MSDSTENQPQEVVSSPEEVDAKEFVQVIGIPSNSSSASVLARDA
jgi:hypothetical protein